MNQREFWQVNGKSVGLMVIGFAFGMDNPAMIFLASAVSVGLYLFIIYSMMWDAGAKAAAKTLRAEDAGVKKIKTPFFIVLFGSAVNITLYLIYTLSRIYSAANGLIKSDGQGYIAVEENAASVGAGGLSELIATMINSIYRGFADLLFPNPNYEQFIAESGENVYIMLTPPLYFFLTLLPLFIVGIGAYYLGASEISVTRKMGVKLKHKNISNTHIDYTKNKK
jgi:hypothetical protein